jgi:hypothetical protein
MSISQNDRTLHPSFHFDNLNEKFLQPKSNLRRIFMIIKLDLMPIVPWFHLVGVIVKISGDHFDQIVPMQENDNAVGQVDIQVCDVFTTAMNGVAQNFGMAFLITFIEIIIVTVALILYLYLPFGFLLYTIIPWIIISFGSAYVTILFTALYLRHSRNAPKTWSDLQSHVTWSLMFRLIWSGIVIGIAVELASFLIIPGLWLATIWILWQVVMIDSQINDSDDCCCGCGHSTSKSSRLVDRAGCCAVFWILVLLTISTILLCFTMVGAFIAIPWHSFVIVEMYLVLTDSKAPHNNSPPPMQATTVEAAPPAYGETGETNNV